jgi:hypothetical protein
VSKTKTVNETLTTSNAFQDDDELFFAIGANETWNFKFVVQGNAPAAADFKFAVTAPGGATCAVATSDPEGATSVSNLACGATSGLVPGNGLADTYEVIGSVRNGSTPGIVRLQWSQQVASGTTTVFAGSSLEASRAIGTSSTDVAFIQDGNTLGADAVLGTNDGFNLSFETNGVTNLTLDTSGNLNVLNGALQTAGTTRITSGGALQNVTADTSILTSGTLTVDRGGTGAGSFTTNGVLYGNATGALQTTAAGTDAQLLIANGSGVPVFVSLGGDATITNTGSLTIANGAVSNTKLANSSFAISYGSNLSGDANVSLGGTLNISMSANPAFTSVTSGSLTSSGALSITSGGAGDLSLDSASNKLVIGASDTSIQRSASGTFSFDLNDASTTTLRVINSDGSNAANLDLADGALLVGGTQVISNGRAISNITGLTFASGGIDLNGGGISNTGTLSGLTGATFASGGINLTNGGITNAGTITGVAGLTLSSGNLALGGGNITGAGSIAGTSLGVTGAISAATTTDTINGLIINAGSLSSVTGFDQTTGNFSLSGSGNINIGAGSNALTINSTNFDVSSLGALSGITTVSASGAITAATTTNTINGLVINSGSLSGITGFSQTSGNFSVTGSGTIDIGAGSNALTINSTNFDVSSTGALSGITTIGASGAISAATATNTINGLVINSGSLSSISGFSQTSGNFAMSGAGTFGTGSGAVSLNGATTVSTATNSATTLTVNGTTGTAATALQIAQTGNAANLALTNTARTSGALISMTQSTSAFTGTGLLFNFASGSGSFASGNFLDFQVNGTTRLKIDNTGALQINSDSATALQVRSASGALSFFTVNDSGNLVQIGSSTSDGTSILLVLDSGTADPTGVNGGSYYNTTDNKARCYEAGVWTDCQATAVLGETTLGSANATINVTLNRSVEYLHCRVDVKSRSAASIPWIRFNSDTGGASYGWNIYGITAAAVIDVQDASDSSIELASAGSTIPFSADVNITNFADTRKAVDWTGVGIETIGTNMNRFSGVGAWGNTSSQISSVQFVASTGTFAAGSHAWCEGRNVR